MSTHTLLGFDYTLDRSVERTRGEWRSLMSKVKANGGRRRVDQGETFIHDANGKIVFEIYSNVTEPALLREVGAL